MLKSVFVVARFAIRIKTILARFSVIIIRNVFSIIATRTQFEIVNGTRHCTSPYRCWKSVEGSIQGKARIAYGPAGHPLT